jgi:molecular chaperone GrpE
MSGEFDDVQEGAGEVIPSEGEEVSPLTPDEKIQWLQQSLAQRTKDVTEANEKYLRTAADFDNYRKRMQRELADFRLYANEQMALELLPVVDHLGLALKHAEEPGDAVEGLQQGVQLVYKQLRDVLEKFGIKPFTAEGLPFDPARHEALMQIVNSDMPENTVAQVMQDGYLYHEKVLRHAKVGVSKRPDVASDEAAQRDAAPEETPGKIAENETVDEEAIQEGAVQEEGTQENTVREKAQPNNPHRKKSRK